MSEDRQHRQHGDGVFSRYSKRDGRRRYSIQYVWKPTTEEAAKAAGGVIGRSKRVTELVPPDSDGRSRLESARTLKAKREKEKRVPGWMPPHFAVKAKREADERKRTEREPLRFENARDKFLAEEGPTYRDGGLQAKRSLRFMGMFFGGRMLDEIRRPDIREYFKQRASGTGVYSDYKATPRSAEIDLSVFRAVYTFMEDCGYALDNPCHRPKSRRQDSPLAPYRPRRRKVIPGPAELDRIFTATRECAPAGNGARRGLIGNDHRAFMRLCYATAGRPESEPCRLKHGEVRFLSDGWALVSYTRTKNPESERTIPVPPEVADALREVMDPEPTRFEKGAHAAWADRYVFRKRGRGNQPWDKSSYKKAWSAVRAAVPEVEGMCMRDLRSAAATWLRRSGVAESVVRRFMGHARRVEDVYQDIDANDLRAAAECLRTEKLAARLAALQDRNTANGQS